MRRAKLTYERAVKDLAAFDKKHREPLSATQQAQRLALVEACTQAKKYWVGAEGFQKMLLRYLRLPDLATATAQLERLIRLGNQANNPYVNKPVLSVAEVVDTTHQILGLAHHHQCRRTHLPLFAPLHQTDGPLWR